MEPASNYIDILCGGCDRVIQAQANLPTYRCGECGVLIEIDRCSWCGALGEWRMAGSFGRKGSCFWCDRQVRISRSPAGRPTVAEAAARWAQIGRSPEIWDGSCKVYLGLVVLGGHGHYLSKNDRCSFIFNREEIVAAGPNSDAIAFPYESSYLEVGGPGAVATGGGFIGGGFGAEGAVEGMLIASVLNAATSRTKFRTMIAVAHPERQLITMWTRGEFSSSSLISRQCLDASGWRTRVARRSTLNRTKIRGSAEALGRAS